MTPPQLHKFVERTLAFEGFIAMVSQNLADKSDSEYKTPHISWQFQVLNAGGYEHVFEIADSLLRAIDGENQ